MAKRQYRKGMTLFHNETHQKIIFGKWNEDGTGACLGPNNTFLKLTREELDTTYTSDGEVERAAREKRKGQCW